MATSRPSQSELPSSLAQSYSLSTPHASSSSSESGEELWDLSWLFDVLRRRALLILQVAVSATTLAALALFLASNSTKPKYEGTFQVQVEPATAEGKSAQSFVRAQTTERALEESQNLNLEQFSTLDYETLIRILQGRKLMEPVLKNIQRRYPEITYESLLEDFKIERVKITKDGKEQGTRLLDVVYTASDPQQILFILNEISEAYLQYSLKERQANIRQGIKFIENQLPQLSERVNSIQNQIEALRRQNNLMDPEQRGAEFSELMTSIKSQQIEILGKVAEAQSRYQTLQQQLSGENAVAILNEFPSFQKLLDQYLEIESQLATTSSRLEEDSPPMQALRSKQENLENLLVQEARQVLVQSAAKVEIARAQQQALTEAESKVNRQFQQLPTVTRQYDALKQELQIATETLNRFLSKNEALSIDAAQQEIPWELTSTPSLTRNPAGELVNLANQNKRILLALATVLAILLAVGLAFLVELLQDVLYTPAEVKQLSKLPLLGTIPNPDLSTFKFTKNLESLFPRLQNKFPLSYQDNLLHQSRVLAFAEAFNILYSNLGLSDDESSIRSIAISSSNFQEGKTTTAIGLANAVANSGKKVLLVDANLRSPQLHTALQLDNTRGLRELLELGLDLYQVIQTLAPIQPSLSESNLSVLTAGQEASNPAQLLASKAMKKLMQELAEEFDFVIYDTPPIIDFADPSLIGSHVDGVVIVVGLGKTKRSTLKQTLENLKISHLSVSGLVVNIPPIHK